MLAYAKSLLPSPCATKRRSPGLTTAQHRAPHLASVIDIAPTILDLLGLEVPWAYQGVSLLRVQPETALFFTDYSSRLVGLREERWKFIYEFESGRSSLFDVKGDPKESINLRATFPERTRLYESRAKSWIAAQKESVLRDSARANQLLATAAAEKVSARRTVEFFNLEAAQDRANLPR